MTNDKARDFFSGYYEGTLESGLCVSFEQKLKEDALLDREYRSFVSTMKDLDVLKEEEVQPPSDLHERISARLDNYLYEQKRKAPVWGLWLRNLAFAGLGAVAILSTIFALNSRDTNAGANLGIGAPKEQVTYSVTEEGAVGIRTGSQLESLLQNDRPRAALFEVKVSGDPGVRYIAVQGHLPSSINSGNGTLRDFAKAVADYFRMPVSLKVANSDEQVTWAFATRDAVAEVGKVLNTPRYRVTLLQNNMLQIED